METKLTTESSYRDLVTTIADTYRFVAEKKKWIFLSAFIGALIGLGIAFFTPKRYVAKMTFVVEEGSGFSGGLSALAGQFGFDLGGSSNGVFSGDNILLFLKSELLCREALLTRYNQDGKETLADRYAEVYQLKQKWSKKKEIGNIDFSQYSNGNLPRIPDSLLQVIIKKRILLEELSVSKPDKKASFIQVAVSTRDERISQLFTEQLVRIATRKYIDSKVKLKAANVKGLQQRADSLSAILNNKTYSTASSQQALIDANPAMRNAMVSTEINTREKSMISVIFAEVVKNLEVAKFALSQETPAIQIVDKSTMPLEIIKVSKLKSTIGWAIGLAVLYILFILLRRLLSVN